MPIEESNTIVAALRSYGANVRYTVYADAGHDSRPPAEGPVVALCQRVALRDVDLGLAVDESPLPAEGGHRAS